MASLATLLAAKVLTTAVLVVTSKEAQHVSPDPPPRPVNPSSQQTLVVRLEQLWTQIPQVQRQAVLRQLTQMLAQQMAPRSSQEGADE